MTTVEVVGVSVLASLLALGILWIGRIVWCWVGENFYLKLTCRHATDISGKWRAEYEDSSGHRCSEKTDIKQSGYKIEGVTEYSIRYKDGRPAKQKKFEMQGLLRNDLFTAYYWNADRSQKGSGAFTLRVSKEGSAMVGKYAWFDVEAEDIEAGDCRWERVEA